jgi:hypothetical protein
MDRIPSMFDDLPTRKFYSDSILAPPGIHARLPETCRKNEVWYF